MTIKLNPFHYDAHLKTASIEYRYGNKKEVPSLLSKAMKIKPSAFDSYALLGAYYLDTNRDSACYYFNKAFDLGDTLALKYIKMYCSN
jgi:lipoprotein NlpI